MKVNLKKTVLWSIVVYLIHAVISNVLWQNPLVANIFNEYKNHPTMKSMEVFGGTGNWVMLNMIFGIILIAFFIYLYIVLYPALLGKSGWAKGLFFGSIIGITKSVPEAFNNFMHFNYPNILIVIQLVNTLLSLIIFGVVLGSIFEKKVIEKIGE
jgi:hypothetical protein